MSSSSQHRATLLDTGMRLAYVCCVTGWGRAGAGRSGVSREWHEAYDIGYTYIGDTEARPDRFGRGQVANEAAGCSSASGDHGIGAEGTACCPLRSPSPATKQAPLEDPALVCAKKVRICNSLDACVARKVLASAQLRWAIWMIQMDEVPPDPADKEKTERWNRSEEHTSELQSRP